jgi:hypothetical protein
MGLEGSKTEFSVGYRVQYLREHNFSLWLSLGNSGKVTSLKSTQTVRELSMISGGACTRNHYLNISTGLNVSTGLCKINIPGIWTELSDETL